MTDKHSQFLFRNFYIIKNNYLKFYLFFQIISSSNLLFHNVNDLFGCQEKINKLYKQKIGKIELKKYIVLCTG